MQQIETKHSNYKSLHHNIFCIKVTKGNYVTIVKYMCTLTNGCIGNYFDPRQVTVILFVMNIYLFTRIQLDGTIRSIFKIIISKLFTEKNTVQVLQLRQGIIQHCDVYEPLGTGRDMDLVLGGRGSPHFKYIKIFRSTLGHSTQNGFLLNSFHLCWTY